MEARLIVIFAASLLGILYHGAAEEQLVLPEGEEHSILCTAPSEGNYLITWGANVGPVGDGFVVGEEEILDDEMKGKRITFTATDDINSTSLRCTVSDPFEPSNSFIPIQLTIIIQGLLSAPDVEYTKGDRSILFIWSPPFSHNITDVEPDISHYLVTIINMEDHHSVLTVNTTDTEYLLQSQDCQLSDYQVEIAAVNVVGVGDKYTSPPLTLDVLDFSDEFSINLGENPVISFQVCASNQVTLEYKFKPTFTKEDIHLMANVAGDGLTTLNISLPNVRFNERYKVTVGVNGTDVFMYSQSFSTFDVQKVEIKQKSNGHEITCYFVPGSQTKGCRIVIIPEGRGGDCELNTTATRLEGAGDARVNVELPAGEYSVVVYDDEQVTEENPAYTTTLSIPGATTPVVGCVFDVLVVESTSDSEENNCELSNFYIICFFISSGRVVGLVIGVVIAVAVVSVAVFVGSLIFATIYSRGRKKTAPVEKDPVRGQESTTETPAVSQDSAEKQSSPSEDKAESSTVPDDQTRTTTPPDTHKGKYIQVQLKTEQNVQSLPNTNEDVLYSTIIVPHNTAP
jgi:hypothetical protein